MAAIGIYHTVWDGKNGSHTLLEKALRDYLKRLERPFPETFALSYPEGGAGTKKPYCALLPDIGFSISHSEELWACAVGTQPLGFDVQKYREVDACKLAARYLHSEEDAWLCAHGYDGFIQLWTYKESCLKYTGEGASAGLSGFSVVPALRAPALPVFLRGQSICVRGQDIFTDAASALACKTPEPVFIQTLEDIGADFDRRLTK